MYKKIMFGFLVSSPLLAVEENAISKRVGGEFVAPLPQTMQREVRKKEPRFAEPLYWCLCFRPKVALVLLAGAVGAVSGFAKKNASFKTD